MNARRLGALRGWEHRREADEAVVVNLPPDLVPLWERVRASIHGETPHARTEAFLEYVEEHPGEAVCARCESADDTLAALLRIRDLQDKAGVS
jgi:hypothetical protein